MFKCLGHDYPIEGEKRNSSSLYLVISRTFFTSKVMVGDVFVGRHSDGFLETVVEVKSEEGGTFVYTELPRCQENHQIMTKYVATRNCEVYIIHQLRKGIILLISEYHMMESL